MSDCVIKSICILLCYHGNSSWSYLWCFWLLCTGLSLGALIGWVLFHSASHDITWYRVKYTGLLGMTLVGILTIADMWQLLGNKMLPLVWIMGCNIHLQHIMYIGWIGTTLASAVISISRITFSNESFLLLHPLYVNHHCNTFYCSNGIWSTSSFSIRWKFN